MKRERRTTRRRPERPRTRTPHLPSVVSICRLKVPLPESSWVAPFSYEHPDVGVEVLSRHDVDRRRSVSEVRLHSNQTVDWVPTLEGLPLVEEVEVLSSTRFAPQFRIVHANSEFVPIFRELHLERRFPFTVRAGEASWIVVAPGAKIRVLLERLRQRAPAIALESVRHEHLHQPGGPLTARQAEVLHRAILAGYFEIPRRVSLTELAQKVGVALSTLSESLAIVEKKLVENWPDTAAASLEAPELSGEG